ncbi:MAG: hypothetical protein CEE42_05955 [Promethearchaeota archaeon Loki_b31]|nr:MAG: hypothetical protein CEE42_05955 [Candidatus Lokiarchaeota archaeon Loki_b31]
MCIDLNFVRFGYSNNAFLQKGKVLLEKFTGTSFNDLIIQALDLRDKAIKLVCDNINDITVTSGFTGYTGLNLLIDLNLDRFLSIDSLINNRDRYIRKFIGFSSWEELLNFVKETYFKNQEVLNWEINFQHFFNFYKINPNKSSKMYFEKFPKVSENTIYRWIKKSKDILKK